MSNSNNNFTKMIGKPINSNNNLEKELRELIGSNYNSNSNNNNLEEQLRKLRINNPNVPEQNKGPVVTCISNNCERELSNNNTLICSNCYDKLNGGSKKKLTRSKEKQLKKIMLLYNKIRTKLLNNN